jgi:hypothetical protein
LKLIWDERKGYVLPDKEEESWIEVHPKKEKKNKKAKAPRQSSSKMREYFQDRKLGKRCLQTVEAETTQNTGGRRAVTQSKLGKKETNKGGSLRDGT